MNLVVVVVAEVACTKAVMIVAGMMKWMEAQMISAREANPRMDSTARATAAAATCASVHHAGSRV